MAGFIDGDLVEKFLDLPRPQMEEIVRGIKVSGNDKLKKKEIVCIIILLWNAVSVVLCRYINFL